MGADILQLLKMGERSGEIEVFSRSNYSKATRLLAVLALGVASCSPRELQSFEAPQAEPVPETETLPSPVTEAPITAPEAFSSQMELLEANGYVVERREEDGRWAVFEQGSAREVIRAVDENNLLYTTLDGQEIEISQESFVAREVAGVGVNLILTIENQAGEVSDLYLNRTGIDGTEYHCWTTPVEIQANPEIIDNYTQIMLEDVWSGRLLYSELLAAESFPEGTLVPHHFYYYRWLERVGDFVELFDGVESPNGGYSSSAVLATKDNDPRRWVAYYRSATPSGEEVIIATEQVMFTDGESSLFFHYIFGAEWPWEHYAKDPLTGKYISLVQSLFLGKTNGNISGNLQIRAPQVTVYFQGSEPGNRDQEEVFFTVLRGENRPPVAGRELYLLDQNKPYSAKPDLLDLISEASGQPSGWIADAGKEIETFQYMSLLTSLREFNPDYFEVGNEQ